MAKGSSRCCCCAPVPRVPPLQVKSGKAYIRKTKVEE